MTKTSKSVFIHDKNGNLLKESIDGQVTILKYDALDRLVEINKDGITLRFTYDSFGRRLSKTVNEGSESITTLFLYQGDVEIAALEKGEIKQLRILGKGKKGGLVPP